jgi:hypothetical protein
LVNKKVETYIIFRQHNLLFYLEACLLQAGDGVCLGSDKTREGHQVKRKLQVTGDLTLVSEGEDKTRTILILKRKKGKKSEGGGSQLV